MIENLVQYNHLEKPYGYLPGMDEALMARLFGPEFEDYRAVKGRFDANAREAAQELLEDASFAGRVDRSPFEGGETVLVDGVHPSLAGQKAISRALVERLAS